MLKDTIVVGFFLSSELLIKDIADLRQNKVAIIAKYLTEAQFVETKHRDIKLEKEKQVNEVCKTEYRAHVLIAQVIVRDNIQVKLVTALKSVPQRQLQEIMGQKTIQNVYVE